MTRRGRAIALLRSNVVTDVFRDALAGNVLAEFSVSALLGAGLIVMWSFSLIQSDSLLRGPQGGGWAHNPAAGRSIRPPATNLTRLNVRATDASQLERSGPLSASPRWSAQSEQNTARPASDPHRPVDVAGWRDSHLGSIVATAADEHGAPAYILAGLAEDESGWRPTAVGKHGEVGLFQLKRAVATWCGIKDRRNAAQNASCGARYLAAQFARFGSWQLAVVAFKAGPETIPDAIPASSWAYAQRALLKAEAYR